jgi:hypothetical protein
MLEPRYHVCIPIFNRFNLTIRKSDERYIIDGLLGC